jgi:hypothetical protein
LDIIIQREILSTGDGPTPVKLLEDKRYLVALECDLLYLFDPRATPNTYTSDLNLMPLSCKLWNYAHISTGASQIILDEDSLRALVWAPAFLPDQPDEIFLYRFSQSIQDLSLYGRELAYENKFYLLDDSVDRGNFIYKFKPLSKTINGAFGISDNNGVFLGNLSVVDTFIMTKVWQSDITETPFVYQVEPDQDYTINNRTISLSSLIYYRMPANSSQLEFAFVLPTYEIQFSNTILEDPSSNGIPINTVISFDLQMMDVKNVSISNTLSTEIVVDYTIV